MNATQFITPQKTYQNKSKINIKEICTSNKIYCSLMYFLRQKRISRRPDDFTDNEQKTNACIDEHTAVKTYTQKGRARIPTERV